MEDRSGWLKDLIRDIPDFPRPGVTFKDITPLLSDAEALSAAVEALTEPYRDRHVDKVVGIEARGFIIAAPVALALGAGLVPVRKAGKLPWKVYSQTYELEYGTDTLEVHEDALMQGDRVLIVDDVLATGGTAATAARMVEHLGARPVGYSFILELAFLGGRARIGNLDTFSIVTYE